MATPNTNDDKQAANIALVKWLWIATYKLIAPTQERIKQEIETHYSEAVAAHMIAGQSEADAQANALMELGDDEQAGKRFRRHYLTESDIKAIEKLKWKGGIANLRGFFSLFAVGCWMLFSDLRPKHQLACFILLFLMFVVMPVFSFIRSRHALAKKHIIQLLVANCMVDSAFGLFAILTLESFHSILISSILFLLAIIDFSRHLRLWNKVRKAAPDWDGTPPQALITT